MELVIMQVFRGELKKGEDNQWLTENNPMRLHIPSKGWDLFLVRASSMFTKVELTKVQEQKIDFGTKEVKGKQVKTETHKYVDIESRQEIKDAITGLFASKVKLTPEQIELAELRATIEEMKADKKPVKEAKKEVAGDDELTKMQDKYKKVTGKKAFHGWDVAQLVEKIEAHED